MNDRIVRIPHLVKVMFRGTNESVNDNVPRRKEAPSTQQEARKSQMGGPRLLNYLEVEVMSWRQTMINRVLGLRNQLKW